MSIVLSENTEPHDGHNTCLLFTLSSMEEYKEYPIYKGFHDAIEYFIYILIYVHIMKYDLDEIMAVAVKTALKSPCKYKISCILVDDNGKIVAFIPFHSGYTHL